MYCKLIFIVFIVCWSSQSISNEATEKAIDVVVYKALEKTNRKLMVYRTLEKAGIHDYFESTQVCKNKDCLFYRNVLIAKPQVGKTESFFGYSLTNTGPIEWNILGKELIVEVVKADIGKTKQLLFFNKNIGLVAIQLRNEDSVLTLMLMQEEGIKFNDKKR